MDNATAESLLLKCWVRQRRSTTRRGRSWTCVRGGQTRTPGRAACPSKESEKMQFIEELVYYRVGDEVRMRFVCPECGETTHTAAVLGPGWVRCDACGAKLDARRAVARMEREGQH